jgi:archaellum component FlaC
MSKQEVTNDEIMAALTQFADSVDKRFDNVDKRFDGADRRFDGVESRLEKIENDVRNIYNILDAHMTKIERIVEENSVHNYQRERLERWIFQLADQAGIKLKYE